MLTYLMICTLFIAMTNSWLEKSAPAKGVFDDPMFLWVSSNSRPLNLLLVRSHQAEIIIVKHLIQGCNNVTRVRLEPRSFDKGCRKYNCYFSIGAILSLHFAMLI